MPTGRQKVARALLAVVTLCATGAQAATFVVRVTDGAGEGFNDATPFVPVGGNSATTLGQARVNVLNEATRIWGLLLQSNVPIQIDVAFDPQTCTATSGTLASAGPRAVFRNFGGGVSPNTFYVSALADALAGANQSSNPSAADIGATFNSNVDGDPTCLGGRGFYYGLDHNRGTRIDLLLVMLHELAHGLGFTTQVNLSTGAGFVGGDGIERFESYTHMIFDEQLNAAWPSLTAQQRVESATRTGSVAWNGGNVNARTSRFSNGVTANNRVRLHAPSTVSQGSSISHFDTALSPSVLMEPNLPGSITTSSTDITVCALQDAGWTVSVCPHDDGNRPPVANSQSVSAVEDTAVTITLSGTDPDNQSLSYAIATQPTQGTLSAISPARQVTYTPNANANGVDSFTFTVSDGSLTSSPATVTLSIASVNDAPTAQDLNIIAHTGQSTAISLAGNDIDGDALAYSLMTNPTHGTLSGAGATLTYRPNDGFIGADSFTYRVSDGATSSNVASVSIVVQAPPQVSSASSGGGGRGGGGAFTSSWLLMAMLIARLRSRPR